MEFVELRITGSGADKETEVITAFLAEAGFEMFEEIPDGVAAYIRKENYSPESLQSIIDAAIPAFQGLSYQVTELPAINWNKEWEKHYDPVVVDEWLHIRAPYHAARTDISMEVIIQPGMGFGTGHHATTYLMAAAMKAEIKAGDRILDMGTGSGVLAILAKKLKAGAVFAVDYDQNAVDNASENLSLNNESSIVLVTGTMETFHETGFDLVAANINRNIILNDIAGYAAALVPGGKLLVSGFYTEDLAAVSDAAAKRGLALQIHNEKNNWCQATFIKNNG